MFPFRKAFKINKKLAFLTYIRYSSVIHGEIHGLIVIAKMARKRKEGMFMKYGHFDDTRREYVISTPATPLPWINYLGSEDFLGMISNTGGGYCFYRDAKL